MNHEIKTVEMVRRIRDEQQKILAGKSADEVKSFYHDRASKLTSKIENLLKESGSQT